MFLESIFLFLLGLEGALTFLLGLGGCLRRLTVGFVILGVRHDGSDGKISEFAGVMVVYRISNESRRHVELPLILE